MHTATYCAIGALCLRVQLATDRALDFLSITWHVGGLAKTGNGGAIHMRSAGGCIAIVGNAQIPPKVGLDTARLGEATTTATWCMWNTEAELIAIFA